MSDRARVHLLDASPDWRGYLYEGREFDIYARSIRMNGKLKRVWFHKGIARGTLSQARDAGCAHINAMILITP